MNNRRIIEAVKKATVVMAITACITAIIAVFAKAVILENVSLLFWWVPIIGIMELIIIIDPFDWFD